jgi:hypothetical protein
MANELNRKLSEVLMANKYKKNSTYLAIKEMHIHTTLKFPVTGVIMEIMRKTKYN